MCTMSLCKDILLPRRAGSSREAALSAQTHTASASVVLYKSIREHIYLYVASLGNRNALTRFTQQWLRAADAGIQTAGSSLCLSLAPVTSLKGQLVVLQKDGWYLNSAADNNTRPQRSDAERFQSVINRFQCTVKKNLTDISADVDLSYRHILEDVNFSDQYLRCVIL